MMRKIPDIKTKYFNTSDYDKFRSKILNAKIKGKELVDRYVIWVYK